VGEKIEPSTPPLGGVIVQLSLPNYGQLKRLARERKFTPALIAAKAQIATVNCDPAPHVSLAKAAFFVFCVHNRILAAPAVACREGPSLRITPKPGL
jgi:hypothetical protein